MEIQKTNYNQDNTSFGAKLKFKGPFGRLRASMLLPKNGIQRLQAQASTFGTDTDVIYLGLKSDLFSDDEFYNLFFVKSSDYIEPHPRFCPTDDVVRMTKLTTGHNVSGVKLGREPYSQHIEGNFGWERRRYVYDAIANYIDYLKKQFLEQTFYENFMSKIREIYPKEKIEDILEKIVAQNFNIVAEGNSKVVYQIPGADDFLVAKLKNITHKKTPLNKKYLPLQKYNFAEPIAENGNDLIVMKKIIGESYSLDDWIKKIYLVINKKDITSEDAKKFLKSLQQIEGFPLDSYINLAKQIKYLSDNNVRMDILNPNNILVDVKSKSMNLIDLPESDKQQQYMMNLKKPLNNIFDMQCLLCDSLLYQKYTEHLTPKENKLLEKLTKNVLKKCKKAGKIVGLDNKNLDNTLETFNMVSNSFYKKGIDINFTELTKPFISKYQSFFKPQN